MRKNRRTDKVSSMIKNILSKILTQEISDYKMGLVTITDVEVSVDLKYAKIYYSIIGGKKDLQKQKNIIEQMAKHLRYKLAEKIVLKYVPRLQFVFDEIPERAHKIEKILEKIRREKE